MHWQELLKGESGSGPETAREAVKGFLYDYVLLDWTPEQIPTRVSGSGWDAHIGGEARDVQGQPHQLQRYQIAVTQFQNTACFVVYELEEIIAEIRRETEKDAAREAVKDVLRVYMDLTLEEIMTVVGDATTGDWRVQIGGEIIEQGEPRSLHEQIAAIRAGLFHWTVFDMTEIVAELRQEEPRAAELEPTIQDALRCLQCGAVLDNQPTGRTRQYCNNKGKCKQAHHRAKQQEARRAAMLQQSGLPGHWEQHHLEGELLTMLQNIFREYGEQAARATTDAVILAMQEQAARATKEEPEETSRPAKRCRKRRNNQEATPGG